ncbi:DUF4124 domain-containing protein [Neptunicella marina]|uniref:DUF4124 domain-containing protein n=1 Tax=Neptunicella marina TaxID=2125989 RepID=A0A8J6IXR1_9ALTE|nr:DUF4124 domain-containing protein [Neptunicella marina]MBC3767894.1 DUF4124 domain-containing protein [Neptunicella marina]
MMYKAVFTALLLSMLSAVSHATLYKVINKDGSVTYTDIPVEGAVPVDLSNTNSAVMPAMNTPKMKAPSLTPSKIKPAYLVNITRPTQQQTLRDNNGDLTVVAQVTPSRAAIAQLFLDGELIKQQSELTFELTNIDRGEHHVQIKLVNNSGKVIALSETITFYLHRASALIGAR